MEAKHIKSSILSNLTMVKLLRRLHLSTWFCDAKH